MAATPLLPIPELVCQQSTGTESLRLVTRVHKAERRCADAVAAGAACDETRRMIDVEKARAKLAKGFASRCGAIVLEHLGFPALCDDPGGAAFTAAELTSCITSSHETSVGVLIAAAYPDGVPPLAGGPLACQRAIGAAAEHYLARRLRARQSCRNDQLSGGIAITVDCRADPAPTGPGTGDSATDRRLVTADETLTKRLVRACADADVASLGFPGSCDDTDGPPFSLADLATCLRAGHGLAADALMAIEYPAE